MTIFGRGIVVVRDRGEWARGEFRKRLGRRRRRWLALRLRGRPLGQGRERGRCEAAADVLVLLLGVATIEAAEERLHRTVAVRGSGSQRKRVGGMLSCAELVLIWQLAAATTTIRRGGARRAVGRAADGVKAGNKVSALKRSMTARFVQTSCIPRRNMPFVALPAHHTKHLKALEYPFNNTQFSLRQQDSGESNGTALWLGAQCLSLYLIDVCSRRRPRRALANINGARRPRAIELGAGIGLSGSVIILCSTNGAMRKHASHLGSLAHVLLHIIIGTLHIPGPDSQACARIARI